MGLAGFACDGDATAERFSPPPHVLQAPARLAPDSACRFREAATIVRNAHDDAVIVERRLDPDPACLRMLDHVGQGLLQYAQDLQRGIRVEPR